MAPFFRLDDCDTLFALRIHPESGSVRLTWDSLPGVTEWLIYRATNVNMTDMQLVGTVAGTNTWLESSLFFASALRAFYRIAARWDNGDPHNYRVIEAFDGTFSLQSYAGQDQDPNAWRSVVDGAYDHLGHCIELYGNTWKRENIDTIRANQGSVWRVAMKCPRVGGVQGFGIADTANEMWYAAWGMHVRYSQAWNATYQGYFPADSEQWAFFDLPIGDDWFGRFGYYPVVRQLLFANDNDDIGPNGILRIDEIRDITGAVSLPPVARFHWQITNRPTPDSMDVTFCSMGCDPDGPIFRQLWSFGDGANSFETNPVHRYAAHHAYAVALSVVDSTNRADYIVQQVQDTSFTATRQMTMLFTGDVMMARRYTDNNGIIETYGVDSIFGRMQPMVSSFDLATCNLECPLTLSTDHHPTKTYYFKGRPEYVEGIRYAGFDFCALANNHNFDYMVQGMHDTKFVLDSIQVLSTGAGDNDEVASQPVFFSKNGLCVAILSFCNRDGTEDNAQPFLEAGPARPGFAMWDRAHIEQLIPAARAVADVVVVQVHSGIEYAILPPGMNLNYSQLTDEENPPPIMDLLPDTSDVALRKYAIDMGADLIVNHHPHVIQGCESYNGKLIAHSMGNFAFDQQLPETFISMAIQCHLAAPHQVSGFVVNPVYIDRYIPTPPSGDLAAAILDYISEISRPMHTWTVRSPFCDTAYVVMDTLAWQRVGSNFVDTLALANRDSFAYSAPKFLQGGGYPVTMALESSPAGTQYRVGREVLMWGNIEKEGATPWNINSNYERYDTVNFHSSHRSLGLNRSGIPSNSVTTDLVYRPPYPLSNNCTMVGWVRAQNGRGVTLQFEFWDARTGGHFEDSVAIGGVQAAGTFAWTKVWQDLVPTNHSYYFNIKVRLLAPTTGTGYAWFDDMALIKWDDWHSASTALPFPNNITYVQIRAPLNSTSASVSYRREWATSALEPLQDSSSAQ